ncbi:MAG TPA: TauD/TfdA family dioxygenase [Blastocatellia bacterium]|nr:TauD/TfdA family dioxygenase [Blastocatellia bacterium]
MIEWKSESATLPLVAIAQERSSSSRQLQAWLMANREQVHQRLYAHGALLFRGFGVASAEEFQDIAGIFCREFCSYVGGNSPRTRVTSHVFTSTEYPREERISLHNEASYLKRMPDKVLFFCLKPAAKGGQTPLADCRRVLKRIDPQVRRRFDGGGVRYVNNLHGGSGLGKSWMDAYGTKDRREVERRLEADGQAFEWMPNGTLRISMHAPATLRHPITQEEVWVNQAEQWHSSSLESSLREDLLSILGEDELPHNAFLGDGSPLSMPDLDNIRAAMAAEEQVFEWRAGDVLLCDNLLVMHGRQPYLGDRKVLAAMG